LLNIDLALVYAKDTGPNAMLSNKCAGTGKIFEISQHTVSQTNYNFFKAKTS